MHIRIDALLVCWGVVHRTTQVYYTKSCQYQFNKAQKSVSHLCSKTMETPPPPKNFNKNLRYLHIQIFDPCASSSMLTCYIIIQAFLVCSHYERVCFSCFKGIRKNFPPSFFSLTFFFVFVCMYLLFFLASTVDIQLFSNKSIKRILMYTYRICCRQIIVKYEQNTHLRCRQIIANVTFKDIL